MLHNTRNLVEEWRKGDAEKLATLEMEADIAWPGAGDGRRQPTNRSGKSAKATCWGPLSPRTNAG